MLLTAWEVQQTIVTRGRSQIKSWLHDFHIASGFVSMLCANYFASLITLKWKNFCLSVRLAMIVGEKMKQPCLRSINCNISFPWDLLTFIFFGSFLLFVCKTVYSSCADKTKA